jgi:hypothetical protein
MTIKRKLWSGVGVAAAAIAMSGAHAADAGGPASGVGGTFPASPTGETVPFQRGLDKILDGEGGEGGIGFSQSGPVFATPALTNEQLALALPGRTIRKDQAVAFYFGTDGIVEGWKRDWTPGDADQCPSALGDNHELDNGKCYTAVVNPIKGPYEFKNGQVCMPAYSGKAADGTGCYYIGFVTKYVMIGDGKRTYGSGKDLVNGRQLEVFRVKAGH